MNEKFNHIDDQHRDSRVEQSTDLDSVNSNEWLVAESAGNLELLSLLGKREELIDSLASGPSGNTDLHDELKQLNTQIAVFKNEIGIDQYGPIGNDK